MVFDLIKDEIAYFIQCQYYAWKGILTYRANALLWLLTSSFSVITAFVTISVVYNVSSGIVGWNYYQMLFLAATGTVVFWATYYLINPWSIVQGLQRGGIDIYLARPYRRLSIILSGNYSNAANVSVIGGMILLTFAALHIRFTPWFLAGYAVLLVAGAAAMVLFILMLTLLAYHLMKSARSVQSLLNLSRSISTYPLSVYGLIGQLIFTLAFPVGLAYYYPSTTLFGETSAPVFVAVFTLAIAVAVLSYFGADLLMRKYSSGGG